MAKNKNDEFIKITRGTRVGGSAAVAGDVLRVGVDISLGDANYLCGTNKARWSDGKKTEKSQGK